MTFYLVLYLQNYSTILLERYLKEQKHLVYPAAITLKVKTTDVRKRQKKDRPVWWIKFKVRRSMLSLRSFGKFLLPDSKICMSASFELLTYPYGRNRAEALVRSLCDTGKGGQNN